MELSSPKIKKFQEGTFRPQKINKDHYEQISYISGNGTSGESCKAQNKKQKFLVVRKMELSGPKIKKICYLF